jgi:hypothetical protein
MGKKRLGRILKVQTSEPPNHASYDTSILPLFFRVPLTFQIRHVFLLSRVKYFLLSRSRKGMPGNRMDVHAATLPTRSPSDAAGARVVHRRATLHAPPPSDGCAVDGRDRVSCPKTPTLASSISPSSAPSFPFLSPHSVPLSLPSDLHLPRSLFPLLFFRSR